jgi:hypothetical protein
MLRLYAFSASHLYLQKPKNHNDIKDVLKIAFSPTSLMHLQKTHNGVVKNLFNVLRQYPLIPKMQFVT